MRTALVFLSVLAAVLGLSAIVVAIVTRAPSLAFRVLAGALLLDQATLTLLYLRLPVDIRPLRLALRIGAGLILLAGALLLVWSALPHAGGPEIAMPALGVGMIVHSILTLRVLANPVRPESA
ncbi:MAG TPA: hypothetical protein VGQ14_06535 [Candidatus Eisenbacteria bacterium]|jgi:hypothetical protein|nr:hypothetical protein [Candidatus Eisenbacteria bacterium]